MAVGAIMMTVLAGCGSQSAASNNSSKTATITPGVKAAMAFVKQVEAPPTWQGPTTPVNTKLAKGMTVDLVNLTMEIPALNEWATVAQQQLEKAGVKVTICDAKGNPTGITQCMQQGIAQHPDVLVAMSLDTSYIHSYIQQADKAGIKVITAQTGTPGTPHGTGAVAEVSFNYPLVGKILGAWFAAQSKCQGSYPQIITSTSARQPSAAEVSGIQGALAQYCPSLKVRPVQNVLIPNWATQLATVTRSDILADPTLKYFLPLYDGMTIYMLPAVRQAGAANRVQMASFNGTPVVMQNDVVLSPLKADIGGPNEWYGYALADQTFRVLVGDHPVASENIPLRLFDSTNIGSINVNASETTWYGPVSFQQHYYQLWGF
jgi:ribose transport system substrate-binding protein